MFPFGFYPSLRVIVEISLQVYMRTKSESCTSLSECDCLEQWFNVFSLKSFCDGPSNAHVQSGSTCPLLHTTCEKLHIHDTVTWGYTRKLACFHELSHFHYSWSYKSCTNLVFFGHSAELPVLCLPLVWGVSVCFRIFSIFLMPDISATKFLNTLT